MSFPEGTPASLKTPVMKSGHGDGSQPVPSAPHPMGSHSDERPVPAEDAELHGASPVSSSSSSETGTPEISEKHLRRPKMPLKRSSGTIIVARDAPNIQIEDEEYDSGDARTMSPRRTSEEVDKLEESAREALVQQAKALQDSLLHIVDRVESVKSEHEKLEGGNKFLQSYIGELMQTSKLTAAGKGKTKGRSVK